MMRHGVGCALVIGAVCGLAPAPAANAARIGVDNVHGFSSTSLMASGSSFDDFRAALADAGHVLVPLTTFTPAELSTVDGIVLRNAYESALYTAAQRDAIRNYTQRAVFLGDSSLFGDVGEGNDRPLGFGDNRRLLLNILDFIGAGGAAFLADGGTGSNPANFNELIAPYGVSFALNAIEGGGYTVTGFVPHPVTAGVSTVGIDFHMPLTLTVTSPSLDLTTGSGVNNFLAVFPVPEPGSLGLVAVCAAVLLRPGRRRIRAVSSRA